MADFTKVYHRHVYPAIAPSNFDYTGKTILVFGISSIIGQAIAASFVQARAEHVVCVNRNPDGLRDALSSLEATLGKAAAVKLSAKQCDMTDEASVNSLWQGLDAEGVKIDVLALVAADFPKPPMFKDGGLQRTLRGFTVNVEGCTRIVDGFVSRNTQARKVLLNISTSATHMSGGAGLGAYGASKMGFSFLLQQMAAESAVDELQIINIHPGAVYTNAAKGAGYKEDSLPWDDGKHCMSVFGSLLLTTIS